MSTNKDILKKLKPPEFTLQGLVFMPTEKPKRFFPSVYAWATNGRPDNAVIYDTVDVLNDTGIPICDAVAFNGLFRRIPVNMPAQKVRVRLSKKLVVPTSPGKAEKTVDGIHKADAKDHHKMHYA